MKLSEKILARHLASVEQLELLVNQLLDGMQFGLQWNNQKGTGMEFSQYRTYMAGDDPRNLDWKVLARTGNYLIKESELEARIPVQVILDNSRSMLYAEEGISKFDKARLLAALAGNIVAKQGDGFKLSAFSPTSQVISQTVEKRGDIPFLYDFLTKLAPIQSWLSYKESLHAFEFLQKRSLILFFTDFYQEDENMYELLRYWRSMGHQVICLHLLGEKEKTLDFKTGNTLVDLESGKKILIGGKENKTQYQKAFRTWQAQLQEQFLQSGISYMEVLLDADEGSVLRKLLM
ncbi:DUF58 domain-containing protein [Sediminitomix flava]|uniref:Uncharacterized protein DUF58 n=1 Tax=Sediminitomix flava TaxID=379075 RepID=A0A315ZCA3_SEDFL|nr:DUF58 domain-containing protein [Sediminitomix flava]PWJ42950.1 uncharacterized protein DUF58 [Sediminitomix flava]